MSTPEKKAPAIKARIENLEKDLAAKITEGEATAAKIAKAYEEGENPGAMVKALAGLRDEVSGMVEALRALDQRWFAVASEEHQAALGEVRKAAEARYLGAVESIEAALDGVDLAVHGLSVADLEPFKSQVRESLWEVYLRRSGEDQLAIGKLPRQPWPRDDLGRPVDPDAGGDHSAQYLIPAAEAKAREMLRRSRETPGVLAELAAAVRQS